ncbi:MAG: thiamine phosphate synthase [Candidatus Omnitrophica bacterium]|nr:thiamine phosphate synthase [Candidatus Omnitrophota bacterium]
MMLKKELLKKPGLYLVTDSGVLKGKNLFDALSGSLKAGLDMVQFRDKEASDADFFKTGLKIKGLLKNKALFIINDRVHMALALDADGVHLGPTDMPIEIARKILGKKKIIGFSSRSLKEAMEAQKQAVDYIAIGAIFKTPVKPDYKAVGLGTLKQAAKKIKIPIIAIGGINKANIKEVAATGVKRIAVVRAILKAKNHYSATRNLLERV